MQGRVGDRRKERMGKSHLHGGIHTGTNIPFATEKSWEFVRKGKGTRHAAQAIEPVVATRDDSQGNKISVSGQPEQDEETKAGSLGRREDNVKGTEKAGKG